VFRAVQMAPGTPASELSLTMPVSDARSTCAAAVDASRTRAQTMKIMERQNARIGVLQIQGRAQRILPCGRNVKRRVSNDVGSLKSESAFSLQTSDYRRIPETNS